LFVFFEYFRVLNVWIGSSGISSTFRLPSIQSIDHNGFCTKHRISTEIYK